MTGPPPRTLGICGLCIETISCASPCLQGGESLSVQRQQLEELYLAHSASMTILLEEEEEGGVHSDNLRLPQGPANFTLLWYTSPFRFSAVVCTSSGNKTVLSTVSQRRVSHPADHQCNV